MRSVIRSCVPIFILAVIGAGVVYAQQDSAQVKPFDAAQGSPADSAQSKPFDVAQGGPAGFSEDESSLESTRLDLLVGRSEILNLEKPIARVSLTTSDVADALVTSSSQLLLNGKTPGTISMFVWDRDGGIYRYEVAVQRDLNRLTAQVRELFPGEEITVHSTGKQIVLSGLVSSKSVIDKAVSVTAGYVDKKEEVVPLLQVREGPRTDQVLLHVRFAEVSRSTLTQLGLSMFTGPTGVRNTIGRVTTQQVNSPTFKEFDYTKSSERFGARVEEAKGSFAFSDFLNFFVFSERYDLGLLIKALQTKGLYQSLAEPNLVAESGKEASFLAGGEFPVPIAQGGANAASISVDYKEYGIRLSFTPVVNGDLIHLKVRPEVSSLDFGNAVVLNGFRIPALSTRRTETELELQNGQPFAIAGLMNNTMTKTLQRIPGIGDIPILGKLFRSQSAAKDQTELVVMITPEILPRNDEGVTNKLPSLVEPFMPPLPASKLLEPPPPPFQQPSRAPGAAEVILEKPAAKKQ